MSLPTVDEAKAAVRASVRGEYGQVWVTQAFHEMPLPITAVDALIDAADSIVWLDHHGKGLALTVEPLIYQIDADQPTKDWHARI